MGAFLPLFVWAQQDMVRHLVESGFTNVKCVEDEKGAIYTVENDAYRIEALGIKKALEVIAQDSVNSKRPQVLIVMSQNVPQVAVYRDSDVADWEVTYDVRDEWRERLRGTKRRNNSLFKADIVIYPQVLFASYTQNQTYWYAVELDPAIQMQLWPGARMVAQVIIPVLNDRYYSDKKPVPGALALQQKFRIPGNIFGQASVGYFSQSCMGGQLALYYPLPVFNDHLSLSGKVSLCERGYFTDMMHFYYEKQEKLCFSVGPDYYWKQMNARFKARLEKYLDGKCGVRGDALFHYRYATIGFYAAKASGVKANYGFEFSVALPAYKYKRRGYCPRVTGGYFGFGYNGSNDEQHYKYPMATMDDNIMTENSFNINFIKSQIK